MSILDRIRKLLRGEEIPEDAARVYRVSRDEREALERFDEERGRAHRHRQTLVEDVRALSREEERLVGEGKGESSAVRRRLAAKQVAEVRTAIEALLNRVDLLTRRIAVFDRQAALIRDRAVLAAPMPGVPDVERTAGDALAARRAFEEVAEAVDLTASVTKIEGTADAERRAEEELAGRGEAALSFDEMLAEEEARLRPRRTDEKAPEELKE